MDYDTSCSLPKSPTINLPPGPSTVDYEAEDAKDDSDYQVRWSNTMDEGTYKSSTKYTNVEVLLLCWEEQSDDLVITGEVKKLKSTFEDRFNYGAQIGYLDPKAKQAPQVQLNAIVASFVNKFDGPNTLLIVYYAGHGKPGKYYGSLEFFGQRSENNVQLTGKDIDMIVWNKTEKLLVDARADVLEIFDCCYAGNLTLTRGEHRLVESLGATKEMSTTPVPGEDSFTEALIWALERLVEEKKRFTTVELLKKIQNEAPHFPKDQVPVLSDRQEEVPAGRIMLHPLRKCQNDDAQMEESLEQITNLDIIKRQTVTLHFDFADKPPPARIEELGRHLNHVFDRNSLGVNRVRWGGIRQSVAARAVGSFQAAGLKRSRRVSMEQQQAILVMGTDAQWTTKKNSKLLTPSSSKQPSPGALDNPATESSHDSTLDVNTTEYSSSAGSHDESDASQISSCRVRNKKQKSNDDCEKDA